VEDGVSDNAECSLLSNFSSQTPGSVIISRGFSVLSAKRTRI
jgi:hypothetical protein